MTVTSSSFRLGFPEFDDLTKYPDSQLAFWITLSGKMFDSGRWGELLDFGTMLFIAHNIALQARAAADASFGKPPGQASGPVNNKSVDKVSIGFDTASAAEENGGAYNLTVYGQQYLRLARNIGAGPVQVGIDAGSGAGGVYSGLYMPFSGYGGP